MFKETELVAVSDGVGGSHASWWWQHSALSPLPYRMKFEENVG